MVVDFALLGTLGFILEFLCQRFGYIVLPCAPFTYFSLLIMFMLVTRWNLWGLIMAPLLAFATILGGMFVEVNDIAAVYDWKAYISIVCGLMAFSVNYAFYRKNTAKVISQTPLLILLIIIDYLLFNIIQVMVYRLITAGSLFERATIEVVRHSTGEVMNIALYGERGLVYNLFALLVMSVGVFVFRSQGVICNVRQKFIDDKRNAELDRLDESFSISEAIESENSELKDDSSLNSEEELPQALETKDDETLEVQSEKRSLSD